MAELVYALDLGSSAERLGGSSPPPRTSDEGKKGRSEEVKKEKKAIRGRKE